MSNLYCRRHQQSWPQGTPVEFGPRDDYGISRLPCCADLSRDPYNGEVGSKGGGASWDAAEQMKSRVGQLRTQCLAMIRERGPLGADRLALMMAEDEDNISPRLSELVTKYGLLVKGPKTAKTKRGNPAHVYQLAAAERRAA